MFLVLWIEILSCSHTKYIRTMIKWAWLTFKTALWWERTLSGSRKSFIKEGHFSGTFIITRNSCTAAAAFLERFVRSVIIGLLLKLCQAVCSWQPVKVSLNHSLYLSFVGRGESLHSIICELYVWVKNTQHWHSSAEHTCSHSDSWSGNIRPSVVSIRGYVSVRESSLAQIIQKRLRMFTYSSLFSFIHDNHFKQLSRYFYNVTVLAHLPCYCL